MPAERHRVHERKLRNRAEVADVKLVLSIRNVVVRFAGITALRGISQDYERAGLFGIIGPNGAGKSTLLGVVSGQVAPTEGDVLVDGQSITAFAAYQAAAAGIARSFQTPRLMGPESVLTNILIGRNRLVSAGLASQVLSLGAYRAEEARHRAAAVALARDLGFSDRDLARRADSLPFGVRRLVEVARALAGDPRLVLLDEPAAGLTRTERLDLSSFLVSHVRGRSILLILTEHDVDLVRRICEEVLVMDSGSVIASGSPADVLQLESVRRAYFGSAMHA